MDSKDIKKILNYEELTPVMALISLVNLKEKERLAVKYIDLKGFSEDEAVMKLGRSRNTVRKYRQDAYKKMIKVWGNNELALEILKEMKAREI